MKLDLTSKHILGIVCIVAFVAIVVLVVGNLNGMGDISGQATGAFCGDGTCARPEARAGRCAADCPATDTDSDGLYDYQETLGMYGSVAFAPTNPTDSDSDDDGYTDGYEVITSHTGPMSATSYPRTSYPDLAFDSSTTSVVLTGTAYVLDGIVFDESASARIVLGITNYGTGTASGNMQSIVGLYHHNSSSIASKTISSTSFSLNSLSSTTVSGSVSLSGTYALTYLQALYDSSTAPVQLTYAIDSSIYRTYGITESDETNNNGTVYMVPDISGLTFEEVECMYTRDCPTGCGCEDKICYEYTTVTTSTGDSTYLTDTECTP